MIKITAQSKIAAEPKLVVMANLYEVKFIRKQSGGEMPGQISHIAGPLEHAGYYKFTSEEAISGIEKGDWVFYMRLGKSATSIVVDQSPVGMKFLRTRDSLMSLENLPQFRELVF